MSVHKIYLENELGLLGLGSFKYSVIELADDQSVSINLRLDINRLSLERREDWSNILDEIKRAIMCGRIFTHEKETHRREVDALEEKILDLEKKITEVSKYKIFYEMSNEKGGSP